MTVAAETVVINKGVEERWQNNCKSGSAALPSATMTQGGVLEIKLEICSCFCLGSSAAW